MSSVRHPEKNHWIVHIPTESDQEDEVTVELRMSKEDADRLAEQETRIKNTFTSEGDCTAEENVGSAVLRIVASAATIARIKDRFSSYDQQELMDIIDEEVDAVRAARS